MGLGQQHVHVPRQASGHRVLRLGHSHAIAGGDDHVLGVPQQIGRGGRIDLAVVVR
jgi:hypothetical protein